MLHTIKNDFLTVTAAEKGAELQSILGKDGTEYLWQGDPAYWSDRALNIFPYVARLNGGKYYLDGELHEMEIHGLAPYHTFRLAENSGDRMVLEMVSDEETYAQYPRRFTFRVIYRLDHNMLEVTYEVKNLDERTMYFGIGGHPGFNVPLSKGRRFEDYRLRFSPVCAPQRVEFTKDCFVTGRKTAFSLDEGGTLSLDHSLFDEDAIVLSDVSQSVTLEAEGDSRAVTVRYPGMQYLGIWHWPKKDAPYVCIEPWCSLPASADGITVMEEQKDLISLPAGETYRNVWTIEIT